MHGYHALWAAQTDSVIIFQAQGAATVDEQLERQNVVETETTKTR